MVYIGKNAYPFQTLLLSHMVADTLPELHDMADKIRVDRRHFQDKPGNPHYDICQAKKHIAIRQFGAKIVEDREIVVLQKRFR